MPANRLLHVLIQIAGAVDHDQPDQRDRNKPYNQRHHVSSLTLRSPSRTAQGRSASVEIGLAELGNCDAVGIISAALREQPSAIRCSAKAEPRNIGQLRCRPQVGPESGSRTGRWGVAVGVQCSRAEHRSTNHIAQELAARHKLGVNIICFKQLART